MALRQSSAQFESLVNGQTTVLEMITTGKSLPEILHFLTLWIEAQQPDKKQLASILFVDETGGYLMHGAAPSLPTQYNDMIHGISIGPKCGSCGTAAYLKKPVIVTDIQTDPLWEDFRAIAAKFELRSCWSMPLINRDGVVRGTYAVYTREPSTPDENDLRLLTLISQTALLAIEYSMSQLAREKGIAEQQLVFEKLLESEDKLRFAIEATELGVWEYNPVTNKFMANDQLKAWFGIAKDHEIDLDLAIASISTADRHRVVEAIAHALEFSSGGDYDVEYSITHPLTKHVRIVRAKGRAWFGADKLATRFSGTLQDITKQSAARKLFEFELNRQVQERTAELEARNKELQQFTYAASHDMQEPLRKILTFSNRVRESLGTPVNEQTDAHLLKIEESAGRMRNMIDDLLEYSYQTRAGQEFQLVDLNAVLHQVLSDLEVRIEQKGAKIFMTKLPHIIAIGAQMTHLFLNLISNALKFSKHETTPEITISYNDLASNSYRSAGLESGRNYIEIVVEDNGIGFDQKYGDQIFELFKRLHNRNQYPGTGIGLALSKKIVEAHKGKIFALSTPGQGASFYVILPTQPV